MTASFHSGIDFKLSQTYDILCYSACQTFTDTSYDILCYSACQTSADIWHFCYSACQTFADIVRQFFFFFKDTRTKIALRWNKYQTETYTRSLCNEHGHTCTRTHLQKQDLHIFPTLFSFVFASSRLVRCADMNTENAYMVKIVCVDCFHFLKCKDGIKIKAIWVLDTGHLIKNKKNWKPVTMKIYI